MSSNGSGYHRQIQAATLSTRSLMTQSPIPVDSTDSEKVMDDAAGASFRSSRRRVLQSLSVAGIGSLVFRRALADEVAKTGTISAEAIASAEWIAGLELSEADRNATASAMRGVVRHLQNIRSVRLGYDTPSSLRFDPEMVAPPSAESLPEQPKWLTIGEHAVESVPAAVEAEPTADQLSFRSVGELGRMLRQREITSVKLTQHCLDRLREQNPTLLCVVTLLEESAMKQAEIADRELESGRDRGPLHGIPWGAKDLIAVAGHPTTWGAPQFREAVSEKSATVASRMSEAGAVLVAKLSLGALAMGDKWFGGMTRNPWNPAEGSSGSSAGSASAVAAGLVPIAIGSETLGSIVSPARRCGIAALRPTFGRVSRAGCMTLSWTMDKIGPMARTIDDCAQVLKVIAGVDSADPTTVNRWFDWPVRADLSGLRIGQVQDRDLAPADAVIVERLKERGATMVPVELPFDLHESSLAMMLDVEAATMFHDLMTSPDAKAEDLAALNSWPGIFRKSHFVSAVDFLHASRVRFELMKRMARVFEQVDLYVGGGDLTVANLTGHPTVVLPTMMRAEVPDKPSIRPQPLCGTLTGRLYDEATLLAVAQIVERDVKMTGHRPGLTVAASPA